MLIANQLSLANSDDFGQGILELVREKSVKSQGILLSIVCGNHVIGVTVVVLEQDTFILA